MKSIVLMVALAAIGFVGYDDFKRDGLPSRAWTRAIVEQVKQFALPYREAPVASAPTVMVFGDSHSAPLESGLTTALVNTGEILVGRAHPGCPPFPDTVRILPGGRHHCADGAVDQSLAFAENTASIRTVILSARGPVYVSGKRYGEADVGFPDPTVLVHAGQTAQNEAQTYEAALRATLTRLTAKGKRIIFVMDNAELGFNPRFCFAIPLRFYAVHTPCAVARQDFDARNRQYREIVARVLKDFPNVQTFDAAAPLCDAQWCWATKDGQMFYHDDNHLSVAGAEYIARMLVPLILQKQ